ncbi:Na+/H+ antiporter subunit E [Pontibacter sp. SGAir0037]|uniref:Na+/H+ antiporter subunit E n=1 Tax=Pontibacter sp. SGAir0037 TaxID=2571030 RepID=UPI0010CD66C4|nr:Na+/H+ antiporter subunit E [Pontibacter sp. SGAir0037]QCR21985.1 cation:proton antiporter [Pontibacter sp. SGAir0037]
MKTFLIHCIIAAYVVNWVLVQQEWLPFNAFVTFLVFLGAFFILWLSALVYNREYFRKMPKVIGLFFFFLKELIMANLKIAYDIITPRYFMNPAIIALPLKAKTDLEISLLANMLTLTPGSLSVDVSEDRKELYVHLLYAADEDVESIKLELKNGFERRILEITT